MEKTKCLHFDGAYTGTTNAISHWKLKTAELFYTFWCLLIGGSVNVFMFFSLCSVWIVWRFYRGLVSSLKQLTRSRLGSAMLSVYVLSVWNRFAIPVFHVCHLRYLQRYLHSSPLSVNCSAPAHGTSISQK